MQHLIVTLIFALCLYVIVRRIVRMVSRTKKGNSCCATCADTSCPLRDAASKKCSKN